MHDVPSNVPDVPRPNAPEGIEVAIADRFRALRGDPRAGAVLLALVAVAAGAYWFRSGVAQPSSAAPTPVSAGAVPDTAPPSTASREFLVVHVAGAVAKPGVVTLDAGARVIDAIAAAGGPLPDADLDRLNLAAPLADGQRVALARRGEPTPALDPAAPGASGTATGVPAGPVDLNAATQADLEALPGIGPTLAAAIIDERERRGGFTSVDDLKRVRGIGDQRFAQLRELVTV